MPAQFSSNNAKGNTHRCRVSGKPDKAVILITHYQRLLNYIKPQFVHVFYNGRIVQSGGPELAHQLEAEGYDRYVGEAA